MSSEYCSVKMAWCRLVRTRGGTRARAEEDAELMGRYGARMAVGVLDGTSRPGAEFLVPLDTIQKK